MLIVESVGRLIFGGTRKVKFEFLDAGFCCKRIGFIINYLVDCHLFENLVRYMLKELHCRGLQ